MKKNKIFKENFGSFIRRVRLENNIGQRELARKIKSNQ